MHGLRLVSLLCGFILEIVVVPLFLLFNLQQLLSLLVGHVLRRRFVFVKVAVVLGDVFAGRLQVDRGQAGAAIVLAGGFAWLPHVLAWIDCLESLSWLLMAVFMQV